jgi:hypothetical protein
MRTRQINIACPRCREQAWVGVQELDRDFVCRHCRRTYHISATGRSEYGARPQGEPGAASWLAIEAVKTREVFDPIATASALPKPAKLGLGAAGVILMAWLAAAWLWPHPALPEGLTERTTLAASAFARGDLAALRAICTPDSHDAARTWLERRRPGRWDGLMAQAPPSIESRVLFQRMSYRVAGSLAVIRFERPGDAEPPSPPPTKPGRKNAFPPSPTPPAGPRLELMMLWTHDERRGWLLDARRTLEESSHRSTALTRRHWPQLLGFFTARSIDLRAS